MFYVGDELWLEGGESSFDIPNFHTFSGSLRYPGGTKNWFDKGKLQSYQDPKTGITRPAIIHPSGTKEYYDRGKIQSFQDLKTGEWMPAEIWADGTKWWYDKGILVYDPNTHPWEVEK